jgi:hypothetical protein
MFVFLGVSFFGRREEEEMTWRLLASTPKTGVLTEEFNSSDTS